MSTCTVMPGTMSSVSGISMTALPSVTGTTRVDSMPLRVMVTSAVAGLNGAGTRISAVSPTTWSCWAGMRVSCSWSTWRDGTASAPLTQTSYSVRLVPPSASVTVAETR